jgi:hypothetical protein
MNRAHLALALALATSIFRSAPAKAADPTTADCLEACTSSLKAGNEHKLRTSRAALLVCAAASCPADIRKECERRIAEVNPQIPTIVFEVKDANGDDLSAVKVTMDGEPLAESLQGTALSIDPGPHSFTFEAAGHPPLTKAFMIIESVKDRRELVTLPPPVEPATAAPVSVSASVASAPPPAATQKILALVAGGVGVAGVGLGAVFGGLALSAHSSYERSCGSNIGAPAGQCNGAGVSGQQDAATKGTVSTIAFVVGGVLVAGGAVLYLTAPRASTTPTVGVVPGGVMMKVAF